MSDVNLSKAVRSNLLSLQSTAANMAMTQERLATGLKVNSALDNPTNFFTAASLNSRAGDMGNLLDSMSNGIKTRLLPCVGASYRRCHLPSHWKRRSIPSFAPTCLRCVPLPKPTPVGCSPMGW